MAFVGFGIGLDLLKGQSWNMYKVSLNKYL